MIEKIKQFMSLADFGKAIDRNYSVVYSMVTKGRYGVSGRKVFLKTYRNGTGLCTTMEDYEQFINNLNDPNYEGHDK